LNIQSIKLKQTIPYFIRIQYFFNQSNSMKLYEEKKYQNVYDDKYNEIKD
jgi:hypothetical protein